MQGADTNTGISYGTDTVTINTGGTARVTTDASGNVGIGTSSPTSFGAGFTVGQINGSSGGYLLVSQAGTTSIGEFGTDTGLVFVGSRSTNTPIVFRQNGSTERMRINSSGRLLVGTTNTFGSGAGTINCIADGVSQYGLNIKNISATNTVFTVFSNLSEVQAGAIAQTGSTTVAFTTSSDYRLKENVAPMTGALEKVAALKPVTYTWKANGSAGQGFIAHELQAVVPDCVTGEKDAVEMVDDFDDQGNKIGMKEVPRYQGVDTSFLVATLVAAIQEQQTLIQDLTSRLTALEGK
jgi:hypothetical protein